MQTGNADDSQPEENKESGKATPATGGGGGSWQGWLTGWYSWSGTDTTDGTAGMPKENDPNPLFIGEPPTTKGKLMYHSTIVIVASPREARNPNLDSDQRIASCACAQRL